MKLINQQEYHKGDCGIAVIATLTQIDYKIVKQVFVNKRIFPENGLYHTQHKDLITVLNHFGYFTNRKKFKSWKDIEGTAIIKVNLTKEGYWHWVVYHKSEEEKRGLIFDPKPWVTEPISHFRGRIGSGQYIQVRQK